MLNLCSILLVHINKTIEREILNFFLSISFIICFVPQKNRLIEKVILTTQTFVLIEKQENGFYINTGILRHVNLWKYK